MTTKVLINAREGTIEIEGEADFVREVYSDFKDQIIPLLKNGPQQGSDAAVPPPAPSDPRPRAKKNSSNKKASSNGPSPSGINPENPKLDKNLDTSGVREFYSQFSPSNHPEKILIFMRFLKDKLGIETPNTDQVYTCYNAVGEKPAAAFAQSFRDTSSKKNGFIDYRSAADIGLTFIGNRYFDHDLKKKVNE